MAPRYWTVTVDGRDVSVAAGSREAAQKIAVRRAREQEKLAKRRPRGLRR